MRWLKRLFGVHPSGCGERQAKAWTPSRPLILSLYESGALTNGRAQYPTKKPLEDNRS